MMDKINIQSIKNIYINHITTLPYLKKIQNNNCNNDMSQPPLIRQQAIIPFDDVDIKKLKNNFTILQYIIL